ncbi:ABC transporter substrate-binding protein [Lederbergia citri]|uniref:Sugar ABC transporter substrate-binding protein n=1 Tax=Lederbergia citri TaxID=2833580 RepID=A0A942TGL5_9BACI|nr:sugar ABC transporter substrate-binding protein [Lederbergia citri]MBS4197610.1 sugar ABC transporter substrate-binding protein [Lederbergia citri]
MKKAISMLVSIVLVFSLLVACSSSSSSDGEETKELTLVLSSQDVSDEKLKILMDEFNEKYPDIKVNRITVNSNGWADYFNKIQTMIAGGNSPDVIRVAIEGVHMFVDQDLLLAMDEFMAADPEPLDNYEDIHPKIQEPFIIDGKTYGFVWDWNNVVMHFNTDLLEEAGLEVPGEDWNLDDFIEYAQKLTKEENGNKQYGFAIPNYYFGASAWLYNNEASILNEDMTTSRLDDPNAIEVMQLFQDLIYKYKVSPVPNPDTDQITQLMSGQVAMAAAGKWPFLTYEKNDFTSIDVQHLPILKTREVIFGAGIFPVLKGTKYPEEAYKLSAFLSGTFSQKNTLASLSIPSRISVMEEVLPQTPAKNWKIYMDSADISKPVESPAQYAGVAQIFDRYMSAILSNQMDAASAMSKAKQEIDELLAKD